MIYQEKISFNGIDWYITEWHDVEFRDVSRIKGIKDSQSPEEFINFLLKEYPNCNPTIKPFEKKTKNKRK